MKKRFKFILFLIILFIFNLITACSQSKETVECLNPIQEEVLLITQLGQIQSTDNNKSLGIGVISFKIRNILYGIGHHCSLKNIDTLSIYKISPVFGHSTKGKVDSVSANENFEESEVLLGKIEKDDKNGLIVTSEISNIKDYSPIKIANKIVSGNAELLVRDETGEIQNYSMTINIVNKDKIDYLEVSITDEKLLNKTVRILQGMSGSQIIQENKLIGILTEVYANRPWKGRGKIIWNIDCIKNNIVKK